MIFGELSGYGTDNCDIFGEISDEGINILFLNIIRQHLSLFNYSTPFIANDPKYFCQDVNAAEQVRLKNNPLMTVVDTPLPLLRAPNQFDNIYELSYCFQLTTAKIDFHPGNVV
jgi:hypothetical protein